MLYVSGLHTVLIFLVAIFAAVAAYFLIARWSFGRAWGEFRQLQQERVQRAAGILAPVIQARGATQDPFEHLHPSLRSMATELRFEQVAPERRPPPPARDCPFLDALHDWEHHHHAVSHSFLSALGHVAHHHLAPHPDLHQRVEPIGDILLRLTEECPEASLRKELRLAYDGLRTGAEQNLEYISRRLHSTAHQSREEFHATLGSVKLELGRFREALIDSVYRQAREEIESFLSQHEGFRINPVEWGRQTAYFREFEQLECRLEEARTSGDLSQVALIVIMIAEDEKAFVDHLHAASRQRDELHRKLSRQLEESAVRLHEEADALTGWASVENQRLQSTVSHQIICHLESCRARGVAGADHPLIATWIAELARLRDQDPVLALVAA